MTNTVTPDPAPLEYTKAAEMKLQSLASQGDGSRGTFGAGSMTAPRTVLSARSPRITASRWVAHAGALREGLRLYQTVFERSALGQLIVDFPSFRIDVVNRALCAVTGFRVDELVGSDVSVLFPPHQSPATDTLERLADGKTDSYTAHRTLRRRDGTILPVLSTVSVIRDDDGCPLQLLVVMQDRSQQHADEAVQRRSQALIDAAIAALPMTFTAFDTGLRCTYVAGGLGQRTTTAESILGKHVSEYTQHPPTLRALRRALQGSESTTRTLYNGQTYLTLHGPMCDDGGSIVGAVSVSTNVTTEVTAEAARRQAEELRLYVAQHDALTGLPDRSALVDHLNALANAGSGPTALLVVDIDDFTLINEGLGQEVGDGVLLEVGCRVAAAFPGTMVARKGGDEFAVVFTGDLDRDGAVAAADRVRRAVEEDVQVAGHALHVTTGVGVALQQRSGSSSTLIGNADTALSNAKAAGTGQYRLFDREMRRAVEERLAIQNGLRVALRTNALSIAYQPIVGLEDRRVRGAEALARWTHPERGSIPPAEFIPVAEQCGLIVPVGHWVMSTVCHDIASLALQPGMRLSVNVSVRQLVDGHFADLVERLLDEAGVPATALTIEVTESALMDDVAPVRLAFDRLRSHGVQVSIDDFGTGYSSLARLQRLPVDVIKLDRSFVTDLDLRPGAREMAFAILQLSAAIGVDIVAEGVETEAEAAALLEIGYTSAQGFLFARPEPLADLQALLLAPVAPSLERRAGVQRRQRTDRRSSGRLVVL